MLRQRVVCVRAGQTMWGEGWVNVVGRVKSHEPSSGELAGFANFDLRHNQLPTIEKDAEGYYIDFSNVSQARAVLNIISYHGFEFQD